MQSQTEVTSKSKKTVIFTIDEYIYGGVTSFVRQYTMAAHTLGYSSIVLGFMGDIEQPSKFFPHAKAVVIGATFHHGSFLGKIIDGIRYARVLKRLYATERIDVLHMSTTWSSIFAAFILESWHVKRRMTVYGLYHKEYLSAQEKGRHFLHPYKAALLKGIQYLMLSWAEQLVTFSSYAKRLIQESYPSLPAKRLVIIPGVVTSHMFRKRTSKRAILNAVWIGRAEPRKGVRELLQAISYANSGRSRYEAFIASPIRFYVQYGIIDEYERLNLNLSVHLIHKADDEVKKRLFELADVFVMPSQDLETFGLTVLESLSHGVPVIGTPTGAIPEILHHIDRRLIAESATPKDIAKRLIWYSSLGMPVRLRLAEKAITYVRRFHSFEKQKQLLKLLYH